jgi:hypothetical protein
MPAAELLRFFDRYCCDGEVLQTLSLRERELYPLAGAVGNKTET